MADRPRKGKYTHTFSRTQTAENQNKTRSGIQKQELNDASFGFKAILQLSSARLLKCSRNPNTTKKVVFGSCLLLFGSSFEILDPIFFLNWYTTSTTTTTIGCQLWIFSFQQFH